MCIIAKSYKINFEIKFRQVLYQRCKIKIIYIIIKNMVIAQDLQ